MKTTVSAVATEVGSGSSVAATMNALMTTGHIVNCGLEIENMTKFPLINPEVTINGGVLQIPPSMILPSKRDIMIASKTSGTATGTYGTVSWLVKGLNRRVVVMWSAPYNFDYHTNWMAVGITEEGRVSHESRWFKEMYYNNTATCLAFCRKQYYGGSPCAIQRDRNIEAVGTMGSSHQAMVRITVSPMDDGDLAEAVKFLLQI